MNDIDDNGQWQWLIGNKNEFEMKKKVKWYNTRISETVKIKNIKRILNGEWRISLVLFV